MDRAHLGPGVSLSRPARSARARARKPRRGVVRGLDRGGDGDDGVASSGLARADRSGRHPGRRLDLSVPVRDGHPGDRGGHLPQSDGGARPGTARSVDRHAGAPVPAGRGARPGGVESVSLRSAAAPAPRPHRIAHTALLGRPRSSRAGLALRRDVGEGHSRRAFANIRRVGARATPRGGRRGRGDGRRVLPASGGRAVKFYYFHLMPDTMEHDEPSSWVTLSNRHYDPAVGHTLYNQYLDQFEYAERLGWDGLCVNEHHQNCYGTMPSPNVMAAMLVRRTTRAKIAILGNGLPLRENPLRIAEEIAMLDVASGGRIISGFVRGISAEYFSTGVNPTHSRDRFYEAAELILRAWTEEGPFSFDGRFYRFH